MTNIQIFAKSMLIKKYLVDGMVGNKHLTFNLHAEKN